MTTATQTAEERALASAGMETELLSATQIADVLETRFLAQRGPIAQMIDAGVDERLAAMQTRVEALEQELATRAPLVPNAAANIGSLDVAAHNPLAVGASLDGQFSSFSEFVVAAMGVKGPKGPDARLRFVGDSPNIRADLGIGDISSGGALVPEEFRSMLLTMQLASSMIRQRAMVLPMGATTINIPAVREVDRSGRTRFGGVRAYWTQPGDEITRSTPTFKRVTLTAKSLKLLTGIENELIADSAITLGPLVADMFMEAADWEEERAFMEGTGAGEPLGVFNSTARVDVTETTDGTGETGISITDIANMESRLLPQSDATAIYYIHPSSRGELVMLTNDQVQTWQQNLASGKPMTLMGRTIVVSEFAGRTLQNRQLALIDWSKYIIGDRQAFSFAMSTDSSFGDDMTDLRGVCRVDGQPWLDAAIRPYNGNSDGSNDMSPFIVLAAG